MTISVGNLSFDAEVEELQHLFADYGSMRKCSLPVDRDTGRNKAEPRPTASAGSGRW